MSLFCFLLQVADIYDAASIDLQYIYLRARLKLVSSSLGKSQAPFPILPCSP
jgi:hypothetical protein